MHIPAKVISAPLRLDMDEITYRRLYPLFLDAYYDPADWPLTEVTYEKARFCFEKLCLSSPCLALDQAYPYTYIQMGVNIARTLQNHLVLPDSWKLRDEKTDYMVARKLPDHLNLCGRDLEVNRLMAYQLLAGIVDDYTLLYYECLDRKYIPSDESFSHVTYLMDSFQNLKKKYGFTSLKDEDIKLLTMVVHNYCHTDNLVRDLFTEVNPFFVSDLTTAVHQINSNFVQDFQHILQEYLDQLQETYESSVHSIDYLLFKLLSLWPNLIQELPCLVRPVKILVYTGNYAFDEKYKNALQEMLRNKAMIETCSRVINFSETNCDYDIVLLSAHMPLVKGAICHVITTMPNKQILNQLLEDMDHLVASS